MFPSAASVLFVASFCLVSLSISKASEVDEWKGDGAPCPWTGPTCIDDCRYRPNGFYQSCRSCSIYIYCYRWSAFYYPCPNGTVWDDNQKRCLPTSTTCYCYPEPETCYSTGARCITSCAGLKDGDYQSCHGCSVYASCVGGKILYDYRPCASSWPKPPLRWDDYEKKCLYTSKTCACTREEEFQNEVAQAAVAVPDNGDCRTTGRSCIRNCDGLSDGDYQSCNGCSFYATCTSGHLIDRRPCAAWLQWDDVQKKCVGRTTTCQCKKQAEAGQDVHYWSRILKK